MLEYLSSLDVVVPTFMSILALVFFTEKTKWLSYTTIALSILAELVPATLNLAALIACVSCFGGALFIHYLRAHFGINFETVTKQ